MNDQAKNGNGALPPTLQVPPQVISPEQAINVLEQAIGPSMTILLKGIQASFPGFPPPLIMVAACRVLGHLVGGTFAGVNAPLAPLMKARGECRDTFERAIKDVPITAAVGGSSGPAVPIPPKPPGD